MIFDFHTHIYPDTLASRSVKSIGDFYNIPMQADGTLDTLLRLGDQAGVTRMLVHSVAITPRTTHTINDFIASSVRKHPERLVGFGTLHPDMPDMEEEIKRIQSLGLKGVKLHPDSQCFALDSKESFAMMEKLEGVLPVLIHLGDARYAYTNPFRTAKVLKAFPRLKMIGAHMGGYSEWDAALEHLIGFENLWVDCSSTMEYRTSQQLKKDMQAFGMDRVLFGSDYPMWDVNGELVKFNRIDLTEQEREDILWNNAARLLGLEGENNA